MWLSGRPTKGWRSDDAHRVASHSALWYQFVTVLSWFAARLIRVVEMGPEKRLTSIDTETAQKNFRAVYPLKSTL